MQGEGMAVTLDKKSLENTGISQRVFQEICAEAEKYDAAKVILFGSRARGTHQKKVIWIWLCMDVEILSGLPLQCRRKYGLC